MGQPAPCRGCCWRSARRFTRVSAPSAARFTVGSIAAAAAVEVRVCSTTAAAAAAAKAALIYRRRRRRRRLIRLYFGTGKRTHAFSLLYRRKKKRVSVLRYAKRVRRMIVFHLGSITKKKKITLAFTQHPPRHIASTKRESALGKRVQG